MKIKVTEGERVFLEKIRRLKELVQDEFTIEDKLQFISRGSMEIIRYVVHEILREEK